MTSTLNVAYTHKFDLMNSKRMKLYWRNYDGHISNDMWMKWVNVAIRFEWISKKKKKSWISSMTCNKFTYRFLTRHCWFCTEKIVMVKLLWDLLFPLPRNDVPCEHLKTSIVHLSSFARSRFTDNPVELALDFLLNEREDCSVIFETRFLKNFHCQIISFRLFWHVYVLKTNFFDGSRKYRAIYDIILHYVPNWLSCIPICTVSIEIRSCISLIIIIWEWRKTHSIHSLRCHH